jgi:hypothetical protein
VGDLGLGQVDDMISTGATIEAAMDLIVDRGSVRTPSWSRPMGCWLAVRSTGWPGEDSVGSL